MVEKFNTFIDALALLMLNPFLVHGWEKSHRLGCYHLHQWAADYRFRRRGCRLFAFLSLAFIFACLFFRCFPQAFPPGSASRDLFIGLQKATLIISLLLMTISVCFFSRPHLMLEQFRRDLLKLEGLLGLKVEKLEGAVPKILRQHFDPIVSRSLAELNRLKEENQHLPPELKSLELAQKEKGHQDLIAFFNSFVPPEKEPVVRSSAA